ncbi:lantibiotic protection ABC transporter ATP-binding subunit [Caldifermentibacillus hisashii]|jgi:gallidermin-class lantibiotic protection ABC transporter ATP-binding subunit|uniref:lantibiotic protection ABC transporter ATP-binding subunit n=1 Tax=Caldifermentibacillus hisashii TaxID=996558 RepID=UPI0022B96E87|nr:lantibiotic protection ABC transporter ATP-binding subunit [Caldifermentibacillus hisashii]
MGLIVETNQLTKRFRDQEAVKEVNLKVTEGKVYGLLGPNGAGKTTLLKMLVGLLHSTSGDIKIFGKPWHRDLLSKVGTLIENPALYGHLTGWENLEVHRRLLGLPKQRINEVLNIVGLQDVSRKKRVSQYSLGMKQRLGIAIALLNYPKLLILDEPTNGLDPMGIREMRSLIRSFAESGITVILSSHILNEVAQIVTDVGIISQGQLRYQGSLEELMNQGRNDEDLEDIFIRYVNDSQGGMYR